MFRMGYFPQDCWLDEMTYVKHFLKKKKKKVCSESLVLAIVSMELFPMVLSFLLLPGMPGQRIHSGHMACHPTSHVPNNSKVRFCSWWHGGVFRKNPAWHLVKQTKRTDLGLPKQKRHATRPPKEHRIGKLSEHRQYFLMSCLLFLLVSPLWMFFFSFEKGSLYHFYAAAPSGL